MADTPAPDRSNVPDPAAQPITKSVAPAAVPVAPGSPSVRPGAAPADTPAQAVVRAERVASTTPAGLEPPGLSTDQIMPTCMITLTLGGVGLLVFILLVWMVSHF